jgi:glutathione S-transferase
VTAEAAASLAYFPGSPFARMARVLIREWRLGVSETELPFPPPAELFDLNPLGQVPVLVIRRERVFPTLMVLERHWTMAGAPAAAYGPEAERQTLLTVPQAGDALTAAFYQRWAGLGPVGANHVGYDPATRNLLRVAAVLDWLAAEHCRLRGGVTLTGIALACPVLWADARDGLDWRRHARLKHVVDGLATRESFARTQPQPWSVPQ